MRNYLKYLLLGITYFSMQTIFASNFSPYADLTLNTVWNSQYQAVEPADLLEPTQASGIRSYHLAFITDSGNCAPAWGGQAAYSVDGRWASHLTDRLRANQIQYAVSFGGANGNDVSQACQLDQLVNVYEKVIQVYQPNVLDFDIENGTANIGKVMNALQHIQRAHRDLRISFTVAVMPEGLAAMGMDVVKQAVANHLNFSVNIMAMDYGPAYVNDMGEYAIQAANNTFTFLKQLYPLRTNAELWNMIEVTPMIGVNDVSVEQFTLRNVDTLRNFANTNHLRGLSMWSISRDKPCADKWASSICSGNNLQTKPYEFSQRFMN